MPSGARLPSVGEVRARRCRAAAAAALAAAFSLGAARAAQAELVFPAEIEQGARVPVVYRLAEPMSGTGALLVSWTDADGRIVENVRLPVTLDRARAIPFALDTRRAVAALNFLEVRLTLPGGSVVEKASFIVSPPEPLGPIPRHHVAAAKRAGISAGLEGLGVDAGMVHADRAARAARGRRGRSASRRRPALVCREHRDRFLFGLSPLVSRTGRSIGASPSCRRSTASRSARSRVLRARSEPVRSRSGSSRIRARLAATVARHRRYRPLYYNLADEAGIADLAAYLGFRFFPIVARGMRAMAASNDTGPCRAQPRMGQRISRAGTTLMPETTAAAMQRRRREFRGLGRFQGVDGCGLRARARRGPRRRSRGRSRTPMPAIEGGQVPGWGGYDYSLLARAVDAMEIYDAGDNVAIVAFARIRGMVAAARPRSARARPRKAASGANGCAACAGIMLWDEKGEFVASGRSRWANAARSRQPISMRCAAAGRALDQQRPATGRDRDPLFAGEHAHAMDARLAPKGDAWIERGSEAEGERSHNTVRSAMHAFVDGFPASRLEPRFVTPDDIEAGKLAARPTGMLILPHASRSPPMRRAPSAASSQAAARSWRTPSPASSTSTAGLCAHGQLADLFPAPAAAADAAPRRGQGQIITFTPLLADAGSLAAWARCWPRPTPPRDRRRDTGRRARRRCRTASLRDGAVRFWASRATPPEGASTRADRADIAACLLCL